MNWIIDKSHPICPQICEQLCVFIAKGELTPKSKIYSVRELAVLIGVNPNTVQKSYDQLEIQGVIYSVRGSGWYVSEDISIAKKVLEELRVKKYEVFIADMKILGLDLKNTIKFVNERFGDISE